MIKRCVWLAVFVIAGFGGLFAQQAGSGPLRVAVVEFAIKGNVEIKDAGVVIADWLSSAVQRTGKYQVLERVLLSKVLEEQSIQLSGIVDQESSVKLGDLSGAQAVVTGSLVEWSGAYTLTARLVDVASGKVLGSASLRTAGASTIPSRMSDVARVLAGELPQDALGKDDQTRPASAANPGAISVVKATRKGGSLRVVLDRGSSSYVERGAIYRILMPVYSESEVSGARVVTDMEGIGFIEVDYVEPGYCAGKLELEGFSAPSPVELVKEGVAVRSIAPGYGSVLGVYNLGLFYGGNFAGRYGEFVLWQGVSVKPDLAELSPTMVTSIGYNIPRLLGNRFSRTYLTVGAGALFTIGTGGYGYGWEAHGDFSVGRLFLRGGILASKIFLDASVETEREHDWEYGPFILAGFRWNKIQQIGFRP